MNDPLLYAGFVLGMLYGMVFFLVSFAFFMRITQQLRHLLPQPGPRSGDALKPSGLPPSLRRHAPIGQSPRFMTHDEYVNLVNGKTQPIPAIPKDTEHLS